MSDEDFTAGMMAGQEHRNVTTADIAAYGDYGPGDGHLKCPHQTGDSAHSCEFTEGWREAWT